MRHCPHIYAERRGQGKARAESRPNSTCTCCAFQTKGFSFLLPLPPPHLSVPQLSCALWARWAWDLLFLAHVRRGHLCGVGGVQNHPGLGLAAST